MRHPQERFTITGFAAGYASVRRFVRQLGGAATTPAHVVILTAVV